MQGQCKSGGDYSCNTNSVYGIDRCSERVAYGCWAEEPVEIIFSIAIVVGMGRCDCLNVLGFFF